MFQRIALSADPLVKCESDQASEKQDKTGHGDGQEAVRSNFFAHARALASPHERLPRRHSPVGLSDNEAEQGLVRSPVLGRGFGPALTNPSGSNAD